MAASAAPPATADLRRAFGLDLRCEPPLSLPALPPLRGPLSATVALTDVTLRSTAELTRAWSAGFAPDGDGERIVQEGRRGDPQERYVERRPGVGLRFFAGGFGQAIISPDGRTVCGAPQGDAPGRFERFLVGRVLPWAALVRGIEIFHAAAVTVEGRTVILAGHSGAGKSSLAVRLVLAGAGFLTDDVLAVDRGSDGRLRAHPGARVAGLRGPERDRLEAGDRAALGPLHVLDDKTYVTFTPVAEPVPLGAVFFITRPSEKAAGGPTHGAIVSRLDPAPAELLLASTFVLSVRPPERLSNLLEICADIAAGVPQFQVRVRPGEGTEVTAAAIRAAL